MDIMKDGGLGGDNNPARLALEEIGKVFPGRSVSCFLSLGTATPHAIEMGGNIFQLGKACARVLTSCERPHASVENHFKRIHGRASPYFRFTVAQGLDKVKLDDWRQLRRVGDLTDSYLRDRDTEGSLQKCAGFLVEGCPAAKLAS